MTSSTEEKLFRSGSQVIMEAFDTEMDTAKAHMQNMTVWTMFGRI